jgi:hypothetical protein
MTTPPGLPPRVVDTDVVSYLFKGDTRAAPYQVKHICSITFRLSPL